MNDHLTSRAAARVLGVNDQTLRSWNESCVGPVRDSRGGYERGNVTAWFAEMSFAVAATERRG